jgi:hypothetical protein
MSKQGVKKAERTHCKNGHELSEENVQLMNKGGGRVYKKCLSCNIDNEKPASAPIKSGYDKPNGSRMEWAMSRGVFGEAMTRAEIMRSRG